MRQAEDGIVTCDTRAFTKHHAQSKDGRMKRLAWFTPVSLSPPGLPSHSADMIAQLQERYAIDLFVEPAPMSLGGGQSRTFSAHDFVWKQIREPYDLTVFELADSRAHDFVWPYLIRYPGLVVLHDESLHQSRSRALVADIRDDHYQEEFWYSHPEANPNIPELGVAGLLAAAGDLWPMRRAVIESSRLLLVDSVWRAEKLRGEASHNRIEVVERGVSETHVRPEARMEIRARHDIPSDAVVFVSFGEVSPHRRIRQVLEAVSALAETNLYLVACGHAVGGYDAKVEARALGVENRVRVPGSVGSAQFSDYAAAADVCLCLQWPERWQAFEDWLRCLAAGRPTIVTDFADRADVPSLDPRDWHARQALAASPHNGTSHVPACVSIDIVDEEHSLRLAMRRLTRDAVLRDQIGRGARRLWESRFRLERLEADFARAIARALDIPPSDVQREGLPAHLLADGAEQVKAILEPFGVLPSGMDGLASAGTPEVPSES